MEAVNMENVGSLTRKEDKGFLAAVFGQFSSKEFWKDLVALIVKEAISSFISVLGGTLIYAVQQRTSNESSSIRRIANGSGSSGTVSTPQTSPNNAFSNGYAPQPQYKPTYPQPGNTVYPGFGS